MSKSSTVYVLLDNTDKLWGVFNNDVFLKNMVNTLKEVAGNKNTYHVKEMIMNTNISTTHNKIEFENNLLNKTKSTPSRRSYSKSIQREIDKIEKKYEKFESIRNTFTKLDDAQEVPDFFKREYNCFREMVEKNISEEDQFNFFVENYFELL